MFGTIEAIKYKTNTASMEERYHCITLAMTVISLIVF